MADTKDGVLTHREDSPTAASVSNRLYGPSGAMMYRVTVATGMGMIRHDVMASTGDEAAELSVGIDGKYPGARVAHVEPAPKKAA